MQDYILIIQTFTESQQLM